jgi:CxxC motif-containing protein (DUF1111 family)
MRTLLSVRIFVAATTTLAALVILAPTMWSADRIDEAPAGFGVVSNGFAEEFCANQGALTNSPNSPLVPDDECNFDAAAEEFTGPETVADGLGPVFNAAGCGECHIVPNLGGSSQIVEKRAGKWDGNAFLDHPGGSLIQDRATDPQYQETVFSGHNVQALRASLSVLGLGFVEAISNDTLEGIRRNQPSSIRGRLIQVPVLEAPGTTRVGRFGWKDQQASLVSFSADAYVNEMGITSPLQPDENTNNGTEVTEAEEAPQGVDDGGVDVELFALFMRSTLAPPRDNFRANTQDAKDGSGIFNSIGCAGCHVRDIVTAAPGTSINGGALKVTPALGNKKIHPFSDFLLHDIGTGDGIVQNGGAATRNMVRTVPLWGLRARGRFMHDGLSFNVTDAILRHDNQARSARDSFKGLSTRSKDKLVAFLMSL